MSPPKNCAVCGDKALGYNFNAVTCESCKAFFRRNALAKKQFTCPFNQNCEITVVTRRFCQKCRLKKCLDIGMKSENIMSEEDKMIKRRKIESNRAKRRQMEQGAKSSGSTEDTKNEDTKLKKTEIGERAAADSSSHMDMYAASYDSQSCGSGDSGGDGNRNVAVGPSSSTNVRMFGEGLPNVNPQLMTAEEMVEFIVCDPDRASQAISKIMRTPKEAISTLEKIINSQKDALRLVSHLIAYPGDGLKIISKIMNSPFNALTVFTKFMSSPTDSLEIISKIVDSPQDVVVFIRNLMQSPDDGLEIMDKFMNAPAEALKMLNKIFNGTHAQDDDAAKLPRPERTEQTTQTVNERSETVIQTMLNSSPSNADLLMSEAPVMTPTSLTSLQSPQSNDTIGTFMTPTASPASYAHASPLSTVDMQYQSPSTNPMPDDLPGPSSSNSMPPYIATASETDIRSYMFGTYDDEAMLGAEVGINSLESVLSEVIRIEYQAFSLHANSRIKEEHYLANDHMPSAYNVNAYGQGGGGGCNGAHSQYRLQHQQPICEPSSAIMQRDLNDAEQIKLRELRVASEALYDPVDEDLSVLMMGDERIKPEDTRHNPKLLQLINLTAVAIKRLIKMSKKITAFRDMCQEDQVALLKGGCTEMMIMRSAMIYDDDRNQWKVPHTKENMGNIRADLLKFAAGNVYEEHIKFISTFDEKWRMDENIILIMCAIVLFTPARPRIIHKDVIRLEQNSYYYLLRRYLESVYTGCEAKDAFIKLIQKISDVERLNKFIINVYLNVNPTQVEPLLREIFDLKNH